jgi:hypothetical protein
MKTALETLFDSHYPDGPTALARFREHLAEAKLGFDVEANINELKQPPQASFPRGLPSFIYYYVPGTQFGSVKKLPAGACNAAHAFSSDGIGLNLGCPIRLSRAFDVLFSLKPEYRNEPLAQLKATKNHFACVEELLWLTLWKYKSEVSRGGELVLSKEGHKAADIDWFFFSDGIPIYLEVKFRPTDWLRSRDCGGRNVNDGFFGDIGHKFPKEKSVFRKCLAAVTGFAEPITGVAEADKSFFALCEKKLLSTPGLNGILYRSLLGVIYICSLDKSVIVQIAPLIRYPELREYPACYPVAFNRVLHAQREEKKKQTNVDQQKLPEHSRLVYAILPDNTPTPQVQVQYPYHYDIAQRSKEGAPTFQHIPPFLSASCDV